MMKTEKTGRFDIDKALRSFGRKHKLSREAKKELSYLAWNDYQDELDNAAIDAEQEELQLSN